MGSKPTIRDVAKRAGVSIATVSYVLNASSEEVISEQAKQRVWTAVRALDYHRAAAAVNLATKRTRNIGIIHYPRAERRHQSVLLRLVIQGRDSRGNGTAITTCSFRTSSRATGRRAICRR